MLLSSPSRTATATATATTTPSAASLEFLAKRRRIANGGATLRDTTGNAAVTPSSSILRKWGTSTARGSTTRPEQTHTSTHTQTAPPQPRYCPGDREQLLRRLATFQELTDWTPKPDRINEIEWAKRGWVCQGKERLRCTLCSKELVVQLGRAKSSEADNSDRSTPASTEAAEAAEAAVVDKYVDLVVTAHEEDCLWRKKGCDDSLLRLPLASPHQALADLRQRYDELSARKDFLPYEFNLRLPEGLDIDAVLANLPPTFFDTPSTTTATAAATPSPNRTALALAVMGWQGLTNSRIGAVPNSASCHACLRRLGLWMFKSKQVDLETNTVLEPAPMDHLDAVREHRFFCPWKNGAVQRNPGGARPIRNGKSGAGPTAQPPGWDVLVQMLKNDAYLRNRMAARPTSSRLPPTPSKDAAGAPGVAPVTPGRRPATAGGDANASNGTPGPLLGTTPATPGTGSGIFGDHEAREEDEAARDAKDKERWARLRRVKSLFDAKGTMAKKLKRAGVGGTGSTSRPNTGHSQSSLRPESQG
ncbi:hypothetical protein HMPREF1624_07520 [Sporothrix schenckii ATCC 58251]|uniref:C3HC-type domain-containing protein n=1 Tax=Sporothrix schenckii (strain ATCC 58251 / de Perez 2211183) TaxID=1391915 RepID=U7PNB8_SPOS1|nr:hypothetical protein HMPREF1624_07520 [Sporothrix schenckii ATCC 58251]